MRTIASIMFVIDEVSTVALKFNRKISEKFEKYVSLLFIGAFPTDCYLCAGASIQPRYLWINCTQLEILNAFPGIESPTVSIECFSPPITVTGANIYLIGAVVTVTCVFYTLVVSVAFRLSFGGAI